MLIDFLKDFNEVFKDIYGNRRSGSRFPGILSDVVKECVALYLGIAMQNDGFPDIGGEVTYQGNPHPGT